MTTATVKRIDEFRGEYTFLSNFYEAETEYDGVLYPTAEHAYQASKFLDEDLRETIRNADTPDKAKKLASTLDDAKRKNWHKIKANIMMYIVMDKFLRNWELLEDLKATGDAKLVEGNDWGDDFWGVYEGDGRNYLGRILMSIRVIFGDITNEVPEDWISTGEGKYAEII